MLILLCLPAHTLPYTENTISSSAFAVAATRLSVTEKNGEQIHVMFVLPESKASVTELFTVADFCSMSLSFSIQCRHDSTGITTDSSVYALNIRHQA